MAYTVTITYNGLPTEPDQVVASICRYFAPTNSYIDSAVYENGYPVDLDVTSCDQIGADKDKKYGKSIYATNVDDKYGYAPQVEPYASTSIPFPTPLAQFKLAVVGGTDNSVTFDVDDYKEAFYYMDLGKSLADQGFVVEVVKN